MIGIAAYPSRRWAAAWDVESAARGPVFIGQLRTLKSKLIITVTHDDDDTDSEKDADQLFGYASELFNDADFEVATGE